MTTLAALPAEAVKADEARYALAAGLISLSVELRADPDLPLPTAVMNIPLQGRTRDERVAELHEVAARLGVPVESGTYGMLIARRDFGGITVEAHVVPADLGRHIVAAQDAGKEKAA